MMINEDVELLDGLPIAHVKSLKALVIADPEFGYESRFKDLPKVNLRKIKEMLSKAIENTRAKSIIICGGLKGETAKITPEEFGELHEFIEFCAEKKVHPIFIKGRHDTTIERYREPLKLEVHNGSANVDEYLFSHEFPEKVGKPKLIFVGQLQPAVSIANAIDEKEKSKCFLYGNYKSSFALIIPSINYYSSGRDVSDTKSLNDKMSVIVIGHGSTMNFGVVGDLN